MKCKNPHVRATTPTHVRIRSCTCERMMQQHQLRVRCSHSERPGHTCIILSMPSLRNLAQHSKMARVQHAYDACVHVDTARVSTYVSTYWYTYIYTYKGRCSIGGIAGANGIHTARQMRSSSFRRVRVKGCPNNIPFTKPPPTTLYISVPGPVRLVPTTTTTTIRH